jgi:hypothetical protein
MILHSGWVSSQVENASTMRKQEPISAACFVVASLRVWASAALDALGATVIIGRFRGRQSEV